MESMACDDEQKIKSKGVASIEELRTACLEAGVEIHRHAR